MPDTAQPTTDTTPLGDWKTSQANARGCITDEYQVRAKLSDGSCLSTTYDHDPEGAQPEVICIEAATRGVLGALWALPDGHRDLICLDYDEFTIAGAALLELRDQIINTRDD